MGSTIAKALRYGLCVTTGSHSFTCHPHTNHTCLYSPFGWYSLRLPTKGWPGWVELGGWPHAEIKQLVVGNGSNKVGRPCSELVDDVVLWYENKVSETRYSETLKCEEKQYTSCSRLFVRLMLEMQREDRTKWNLIKVMMTTTTTTMMMT